MAKYEVVSYFYNGNYYSDPEIDYLSDSPSAADLMAFAQAYVDSMNDCDDGSVYEIEDTVLVGCPEDMYIVVSSCGIPKERLEFRAVDDDD